MNTDSQKLTEIASSEKSTATPQPQWEAPRIEVIPVNCEITGYSSAEIDPEKVL